MTNPTLTTRPAAPSPSLPSHFAAPGALGSLARSPRGALPLPPPQQQQQQLSDESLRLYTPQRSRSGKQKRARPESEHAPPTLSFKTYPARADDSRRGHQPQPEGKSDSQPAEAVVDIGELIEAGVDDDEMAAFVTFLDTSDTRDMVLRANALVNWPRKKAAARK